MFADDYKGRRVLVTGHTGFKGSWLCEWLLSLDAVVAGYALDPLEHEILYGQLGLSPCLAEDVREDLSNLEALTKLISGFQPEIILHLAAQPLVRLSYDQPLETFETNVMGTAKVLEAVRQTGHACTVVCVTTDKCYENREWDRPYREDDAMGGHDPYSASKGAAELVIASYRRSFFQSGDHVRVASARAGNVIGGGDWALDRIVPDCIRSIRAGESIAVRNRIATRPWQHVLEPLSGYLQLGASLATASGERLESLASAFNFGPGLESNRTVEELVIELIANTGGEWNDASDPNAVHEATKLDLAIEKADELLAWKPTWDFAATIRETAAWYQAEAAGEDPAELTRQQIQSYHQQAATQSIDWAK